MIYQIDAKGKPCPIPVVETRKALEGAARGDIVETLVDNEIAVQNLEKMAVQKGLVFSHTQEAPDCWRVRITAGPAASPSSSGSGPAVSLSSSGSSPAASRSASGASCPSCPSCTPLDAGTVVVFSADHMGEGDPVLGRLLVKSFLYALTSRDALPGTLLLYNGGAKLSVEGADTLEDLRALEAAGVEILTCGTCLNHYGLTEKLGVGSVTNMYEICDRLLTAEKLVKI